MKLIVVQTLDNQVLDKEIDDIKQIKTFLYLLEENNLQVKDDILYFIDYEVHKISKVNINFIYDSKFIDIYKALKKNNYLKDYILDYLGDYSSDLDNALQLDIIPQQFNNFNQRVNSKYKYGSVFKKIKKQQFLEDGNIDKLYNIDPLPKKPYFIWLVEQYKSGKLLTEDFFKAEELLEQFSNKRLRSDLKKNGYPVKIEHYDSINDLFSAINSLDDSIDHNLDEKYALVQARKVTENNDWIISVPKTYEESVLISRYGGMTNWCTAADSDNGRKMFNKYTNNGDASLFICINKNNPEEKYQVNNNENNGFSFMDKDNEEFDFFNNNNIEFIDLLQEPEIKKELYCEDSIHIEMYKDIIPPLENGKCDYYYKASNLRELNIIFSKCLSFRELDLSDIGIKELPKGLSVNKTLNLINTKITELPEDLIVGGNLFLSKTPIIKLPDNLTTINGDLVLFKCPNITELPEGLTINADLCLTKTISLKKLPNNLKIKGNLVLMDSGITELPEDLKVGGKIDLSNTLITELPEGLKVGGDLNLRMILNITKLSNNLEVGGNLVLNKNITELPEGLKVGGYLDLMNSGITELPDDLIVSGEIKQ